MRARIAVAGLVGGLVLFFWGFLSHAVIGLGEAGMDVMPAQAETAVVDTLRSESVPSGMYFVPGVDMERWEEPEVKAAWEAKLRQGPSALLVVHAGPGEPMSATQLVRELLTDVVIALIAAMLLSSAAGCCTTLPSRIGFVAALGLLLGMAHNVRYWNWYHFPPTFTLCSMLDYLIAMTLVGVAVALIVKPKACAPSSGGVASPS